MDKKDVEGYVEKLVKECGCPETKAREMVEEIIQKASIDEDVVFVIDVVYKDGNSYKTEQTSDTIDYPWHNKRIAIENLQAINEHLDFVKRLNNYSRRSEKDLLKEFSKKWWFVKDEGYSRMYECSIRLKKDNGIDTFQTSTPWTGFFSINGEHEVKLKIIDKYTNPKEYNKIVKDDDERRKN